jgi:hypothetical protein
MISTACGASKFVDHDAGRVLSVRCERGPKAAFVRDGAAQRSFVRGANATAELVVYANSITRTEIDARGEETEREIPLHEGLHRIHRRAVRRTFGVGGQPAEGKRP